MGKKRGVAESYENLGSKKACTFAVVDEVSRENGLNVDNFSNIKRKAEVGDVQPHLQS